MHMDDGAKRSRLPRRRPAKEVHLENLHADISRLITSDSRQEAGRRRAGGGSAAAVTNLTGGEMDSDLHVPGGLVAWLRYEIQITQTTHFPPSCLSRKRRVNRIFS